MLKGPKRSFVVVLVVDLHGGMFSFLSRIDFFYYNLEIDFLMIVAVFEAAQNQH